MFATYLEASDQSYFAVMNRWNWNGSVGEDLKNEDR